MTIMVLLHVLAEAVPNLNYQIVSSNSSPTSPIAPEATCDSSCRKVSQLMKC